MTNPFKIIIPVVLVLLIGVLGYYFWQSKIEIYDILNDSWALEFINGEEFVKSEDRISRPTLEIYLKEERIHGNAGCNTFNGKVELDGNKIAFLNISATEMFCPGNIEGRFLSALQSVNTYKIEKSKLILYEDKDERLVFRNIN